jgi:hypothetical protein
MPLGNFLDFSLIFQINRAGGGSNKAARNWIHRNCPGRLRHLGDRWGLDRVPFSESDDVLAFQLHLISFDWPASFFAPAPSAGFSEAILRGHSCAIKMSSHPQA